MIHIQEAQHSDIDFIAEIARKTWYVTYPSIITMEQIAFMLKKNYDADVLMSQIGKEGHLFLLIEDEKTAEIYGFMHFTYSDKQHFHLQKFYISPQAQSKNIGAKAFLYAETYLKNLSQGELKAIRLNVNRKNYKAINFYFKVGMFIEEVKDIPIGDDFFMNDFIMLKKYDV